MGRAERYVEDYFCDQVIKLGGEVRKNNSFSHNGVFDRIMYFRGICLVELKSASGELSRLQFEEGIILIKHSVPFAILNSREAVDAFLYAWRTYDQRDAVSKFGVEPLMLSKYCKSQSRRQPSRILSRVNVFDIQK